jgi:hypothetical protein
MCRNRNLTPAPRHAFEVQTGREHARRTRRRHDGLHHSDDRSVILNECEAVFRRNDDPCAVASALIAVASVIADRCDQAEAIAIARQMAAAAYRLDPDATPWTEPQ